LSLLVRQTALVLSLVILFIFPVACKNHRGQLASKEQVSPCYVVYDAGSKGTRLYIYQLQASQWIEHQGPRSSALADPVREIRDKTMSDAGVVVDDIVSLLDEIRVDGPLNKKGEPKWPGFDWQQACRIDAVSVYATAGMRLAEQEDAEASAKIWQRLNDSLSERFDAMVTTRTLSGFEEGLYAWLAMREQQEDGGFGIAEMGGASIQVTFPCSGCETSRPVKVKGGIEEIFSYSFLGWGQDEAWKKFGALPACARGAGKNIPGWQVQDCAVGMSEFSDAAREVEVMVEGVEDDLRWYLSDAFRYMQDSDIDEFCRMGTDSGYEPVSSCFRAVYLRNVITTMGLPLKSESTDINWALGAVVCTTTRCLEVQ
jgi:hypothetical protein